MTTTYVVCGAAFESKSTAKYCPECRAAGKRICTICGKMFKNKNRASVCSGCKREHGKAVPTKRVCMICECEFEDVGGTKTCPACRAAEEKRLEEWRRKRGGGRRAPNDPQHLADMVREARAAGMSYG